MVTVSWCVKRLFVELRTLLSVIYDYAIKQCIFDGFFKLNFSRHPAVMTLRPAAADGIGTVLHEFES